MQRYFVDTFERTPGAHIESAVRSISVLRKFADEMDIPTIYTVQPPKQSPAERGLLVHAWGDGMQTAEEAEITPELAPRPTDRVITKWRYSAFEKNELQGHLKSLGRDQLMITGVYGHIGVQTTALAAFMLDLQAFVVTDAVADFSRQHHLAMQDYVGSLCGRVLTTNDILSAECVSETSVTLPDATRPSPVTVETRVPTTFSTNS